MDEVDLVITYLLRKMTTASGDMTTANAEMASLFKQIATIEEKLDYEGLEALTTKSLRQYNADL